MKYKIKHVWNDDYQDILYVWKYKHPDNWNRGDYRKYTKFSLAQARDFKKRLTGHPLGIVNIQIRKV